MKVNITNREIYFATHSCWYELPFKLQIQLNKLVTENSGDDYLQEVDIDAESFVKVMLATNAQPQGVAKDINPPMHISLKAQIQALALPIFAEMQTITDAQALADFKELHKEILTIAERVTSILTENEEVLERKILSGKIQILGE